MTIDCIGLSQDLVRIPSLNPPGDEQACIEHLARLLSAEGFANRAGQAPLLHRPCRCRAARDRAVTVAPFGGEIHDSKLFGRALIQRVCA